MSTMAFSSIVQLDWSMEDRTTAIKRDAHCKARRLDLREFKERIVSKQMDTTAASSTRLALTELSGISGLSSN